MTIEKKINLKNNIYYITVEVEYKKNEQNITKLCLKNYKDKYFDGGDLSILIEKISKNYDYEKSDKYDDEIRFMGDVIYIYDRIPFLSGIKDAYIGKNDNLPSSIAHISKEEIDKYIEEHNIIMTEKPNFKLYDEESWFI